MATTVTVAGSVVVGRSQLSAEPFSKVDIADCDGKPCVQGVIAGVTRWSDATTRFAGDGSNIVINTNKLVQTTLTADTASEKVFAISMLFGSPYIPLSTLFAQYGMPCKFRTYKTGSLEVIYPQLAAVVEGSVIERGQIPKLSPDLKIKQMYFYAMPNSCNIASNMPSDLFFDTEWHTYADVIKRITH
jgi:hypothetical protein